MLILVFLCNSNYTKANETLRVGTTLWPGYEPIYLAESMGLFNNQNIRPIDYPSTSEVLRAFKNRALEVAALTLDEVVSLQEINVPVKIILVCDISHGGDVIVSKPDIKSMAELKGKRVAVESTAVGAYVLSRALQTRNLSLSDIVIVNMDVNSNISAFQKNRADAFVTYEPIRTKLLNLGLHEIFTSREIPGEVVDVIVVHESAYQIHKKQLTVLVDSWFKALQEMRDRPESSYQFIANRMKITTEEVALSYHGLKLPEIEENLELLSGEKPKLQNTLNKLTSLMLETNLISKRPKQNNMISDKFIPRK